MRAPAESTSQKRTGEGAHSAKYDEYIFAIFSLGIHSDFNLILLRAVECIRDSAVFERGLDDVAVVAIHFDPNFM